MSELDDFREKNKPLNIKAIFDLIMGLIYAIVGALLVSSKYLGLELAFPPPDVIMIFGAFAVLYGVFRIYRGYKLYKEA